MVTVGVSSPFIQSDLPGSVGSGRMQDIVFAVTLDAYLCQLRVDCRYFIFKKIFRDSGDWGRRGKDARPWSSPLNIDKAKIR